MQHSHTTLRPVASHGVSQPSHHNHHSKIADTHWASLLLMQVLPSMDQHPAQFQAALAAVVDQDLRAFRQRLGLEDSTFDFRVLCPPAPMCYP
jgi:hypothetical protein